ncbi:MAG: tRNA uridine-5-carboxymethylaminomethyl(34) synthesis enzyme MnmG, partial [Phycisphaerales bacterium]|nr:tRNA uridine-5-carboxymethylaminomethyl(34) synthesis enzyme MnmG [Phycisphaerales bacterium]
VMSCNPAIGGLGKGHLVREIDALGGLMGVVTDATGIMFRMLNTSKGAAVQSPRAQCDKHAYAREVRRLITTHPRITVVAGAAERLLLDDRGHTRAVTVASPDPAFNGVTLHAGAVVLTTGTFMRGLMHTGETQTEGGRHGEAPARTISDTLRELGFELGRLKTGTPPRLQKSSIDWEGLEPQHGDDPPVPFSDLSDAPRFPRLEQVECRITSTTPQAHEVICANIHRAPMFSGQIESIGPRYCPSIEDKVVRFADRERHHVFLEPESHESDWIYCNGIATSLPTDVQDEIIHSMPGCRNARILMYGYAVEYDMVRPHQIHATTMTRRVPGLFLAGQINGTSGYEEAGGQGYLAGLNAARHARALEPVTLGRDLAYIGVMLDDLVTRTPVEPYRMFTSRAEYRLLLRADNTADRLTRLGHEWGTVGAERWHRFQARCQRIEHLNAALDAARLDGRPLRDLVRRPDFTVNDLARALGEAPDRAMTTVLADRQYEGYIVRQHAEIKRHAAMEHRRIPADVDFHTIAGLRAEAAEALTRFRPDTLGQAGRLAGVNPADMTLLVVALDRRRRETA